MRPQKRAYILLFILFIPCFGIAQSQIQIIPKPVSLTAQDKHFIIDKNTSLIFKTDKNDLHRAALFFNSFIKSVSGITLPLNDKRSRSPNEKSTLIKDFTLNFPRQNARYIRVTAKNIGVCPKGHPGEGKPAWIFADEIMVQ